MFGDEVGAPLEQFTNAYPQYGKGGRITNARRKTGNYFRQN